MENNSLSDIPSIYHLEPEGIHIHIHNKINKYFCVDIDDVMHLNSHIIQL